MGRLGRGCDDSWLVHWDRSGFSARPHTRRGDWRGACAFDPRAAWSRLCSASHAACRHVDAGRRPMARPPLPRRCRCDGRGGFGGRRPRCCRRAWCERRQCERSVPHRGLSNRCRGGGGSRDRQGCAGDAGAGRADRAAQVLSLHAARDARDDATVRRRDSLETSTSSITRSRMRSARAFRPTDRGSRLTAPHRAVSR